MQLNRIEKMFEDKAIIRGGIFLLDAHDSLEFIEECMRQSIGLFGVDGFFLFEGKIQPSLEHSIDFTVKKTTNAENGHYEQAKQLIIKHETMYFEIVVDC